MRALLLPVFLFLLASCASRPAPVAPSSAETVPSSVHIRVLVLKPARGRVQLSASAHPEPLEEERFDPEGDCLLVVKDQAGGMLAKRKVGFGSEIADHRRGRMKLIDVSIEAPDSADSVELFEGGKRTGKAPIRWKEEPPPFAI